MVAKLFGHGDGQHKYLYKVGMRMASAQVLVRAHGVADSGKHGVENLVMKIERDVILE